jgi:hypothetical protein
MMILHLGHLCSSLPSPNPFPARVSGLRRSDGVFWLLLFCFVLVVTYRGGGNLVSCPLGWPHVVQGIDTAPKHAGHRIVLVLSSSKLYHSLPVAFIQFSLHFSEAWY